MLDGRVIVALTCGATAGGCAARLTKTTMYKIIGADGKEYGPISVDVVRKWIAEGRANAQTKILPEGATEWVTVAQVPELAASAPTIAPLPSSYAPTPGLSAGSDLVAGPAIGLIVTAALGYLATVFGAVWNIVGPRMGMNQPGVDPEMQKFITMFSGTMGVVSGILGLVVSSLILFGALKMKKCQSYGWAMAASILAVIPCISPCCLVGIPIGIWALVVLSKPEVKAQFQ